MNPHILTWHRAVVSLYFIALLGSPGLGRPGQVPNALEKNWPDLAAEDAELAYRAIWRLAQNPEAAEKLLKERMKATEAPDLAQIQTWVTDLSSPTFAVRDKANRELMAQGELAEQPLRKALEGQIDLETRRRLELLINKIEQPVTAPEKIRELRAVEALEIMGTDQAKELLQRLAKGYSAHRQTRQAQESLQRLEKRAPAPAEWLAWIKNPPPVIGTDNPLPFGARKRLGTLGFRHQSPGKAGAYSSAFSPDGRRVISHDLNAVYVWETQTGNLQRKFNFTASCLAAAPKDTLAAVGLTLKDTKSGAVICLDWQNGKELSRWELPAGVTPRQLAFSPDGAKIFCDRSDNSLCEWDIKSGKETTLWQPAGKLNKLYGFSPNATVVVVGSGTDFYVLNLKTKQEHRLPAMDREPRLAAFSPDNKLVALAADRPGERLHICEVATGKLLSRSDGGVGLFVYSLRFSPDGKVLAVGSYQQEASLWDSHTGKLLRSLRGSHDHSIGSFSADRRWLVTAGQELSVWDLESGQRLLAGDGHTGDIEGVAISPRYDWIVSYDRRKVLLWDPMTAKPKLRLDTGGTWVRGVSVSPDGKLIAAAHPGPREGFVKVWEAASGRLVYHFPGHAAREYGSMAEVHFSPDGRFLLSWGDDPYFRKWDVKTGRALQEFQTHIPETDRRALDSAGKRQYGLTPQFDRLLMLEFKGALHSFAVDTGKEGPVVDIGTANSGGTCTFSPAGKLLAIARRDIDVAVRDTTSGKLLFSHATKPATAYAFPGGPKWMSFSPDGRTLAVAGVDKIVIFEAVTGKARMAIPAKVRALTFSADSRFLVTAMTNTTALLWDLALLAEAPKK